MDFVHLIGSFHEGIDGSIDCYLNVNEIVSFWFEDVNGQEVAVVETKRFRVNQTVYVLFYSDDTEYFKSIIK